MDEDLGKRPGCDGEEGRTSRPGSRWTRPADDAGDHEARQLYWADAEGVKDGPGPGRRLEGEDSTKVVELYRHRKVPVAKRGVREGKGGGGGGLGASWIPKQGEFKWRPRQGSERSSQAAVPASLSPRGAPWPKTPACFGKLESFPLALIHRTFSPRELSLFAASKPGKASGSETIACREDSNSRCSRVTAWLNVNGMGAHARAKGKDSYGSLDSKKRTGVFVRVP